MLLGFCCLKGFLEPGWQILQFSATDHFERAGQGSQLCTEASSCTEENNKQEKGNNNQCVCSLSSC